MQKLAKHLNLPLQLVPGRWDDIVAKGRLGQFGCVVGMEISPKRQKWFDFTQAYYQRRINVFVRRDNRDLKTLPDLVGGIISGDRDLAIEHEMDALGIRQRIRVGQMPSKQDSMLLLRQGEVSAVVMPDAVAHYLAQRLGVAIRPLQRQAPPGSAVACGAARRCGAEAEAG